MPVCALPYAAPDCHILFCLEGLALCRLSGGLPQGPRLVGGCCGQLGCGGWGKGVQLLGLRGMAEAQGGRLLGWGGAAGALQQKRGGGAAGVQCLPWGLPAEAQRLRGQGP